MKAKLGIPISVALALRQIRRKFARNYIYNLSRSANGETLKFNIILEFSGGVRKMCALEYKTPRKVLRVITFY